MTDQRLDIHVDRSVAQTCARAGKGEQMGAEDKGGRRRAGADYLEQGPATSAEEVVIGLLGDAFSEARRGMPHDGRFARFSEIAQVLP